MTSTHSERLPSGNLGLSLKTLLYSWLLQPSGRKGSILPQDGYLKVRSGGESTYSSEPLKHQPSFLCCQHQVKASTLPSRPMTCDYTSFPCSPSLSPVTNSLNMPAFHMLDLLMATILFYSLQLPTFWTSPWTHSPPKITPLATSHPFCS